MKIHQGFTLVELLMVLAILSVITAFALPSYQEYIRKKDRAAAQQTMQRVALELEQWRGKNFSYVGFTTDTPLTTPIYTITITNGDGLALGNGNNGFTWRMHAVRNDVATHARNYDLLMTSAGLRCMTRAENVVNQATNANCGTDGETW